MANLERGLPAPKGKGRATLSVRDPLVESLVVGLGVENETLAELRAACKALVASRNAWDVNRRRFGLFGSRRISRDEAPRVLARALAELVGARQ